MPLISPTDQDKLRDRFAQALERDVRLVLFAEPPSGLFIPGRQESQTGRTAQQLMEEVAALSPKLHLEVHNLRGDPEVAQAFGVERSPALILLPADASGSASEAGADEARQTGSHADGQPGAQDASATPSPTEVPAGAQATAPPSPGTGAVRFFGLPSGYEFMTLVEDLVDLSAGHTRLASATRQAVAAFTAPVHLQVFVTPT
jgi:hypothetical protein